MPPHRDNQALLAETLAATGLMAVGFLTLHPAPASLAALGSDVGVNWVASLAERGFRPALRGWSRELSGGSDALSRGLSLALQRAVTRVTPELEREERYLGLRHRNKDAAAALRESKRGTGTTHTWG